MGHCTLQDGAVALINRRRRRRRSKIRSMGMKKREPYTRARDIAMYIKAFVITAAR
jgi:hypothetical protein